MLVRLSRVKTVNVRVPSCENPELQGVKVTDRASLARSLQCVSSHGRLSLASQLCFVQHPVHTAGHSSPPNVCCCSRAALLFVESGPGGSALGELPLTTVSRAPCTEAVVWWQLLCARHGAARCALPTGEPGSPHRVPVRH